MCVCVGGVSGKVNLPVEKRALTKLNCLHPFSYTKVNFFIFRLIFLNRGAFVWTIFTLVNGFFLVISVLFHCMWAEDP